MLLFLDFILHIIQSIGSVIQFIASLGIHFIFIHAIIYIEKKGHCQKKKKKVNIETNLS